MKPSLIITIGFAALSSVAFQSCGKLDPACENGSYVEEVFEYVSGSGEVGTMPVFQIIKNLNSVLIFTEKEISGSCGSTSLSVKGFMIYRNSFTEENNNCDLFPLVRIDGENQGVKYKKPVGPRGTNIYLTSIQVMDKATPAGFTIGIGVLITGIDTMKPSEEILSMFKSAVTTFSYSVEYLKVN